MRAERISSSANIPTNSDSSTSNTKPTTNEPLTGTPFRIVNIPDHGWFVTLGIQRVTEGIYPTREEAIKPVKERDWNFLCNVIVTLYEQLQGIHKLENVTTKKQATKN